MNERILFAHGNRHVIALQGIGQTAKILDREPTEGDWLALEREHCKRELREDRVLRIYRHFDRFVTAIRAALA